MRGSDAPENAKLRSGTTFLSRQMIVDTARFAWVMSPPSGTSMRMILPGVRERRAIDRQLTGFFRRHREFDFRCAIQSLSRFYHLRQPRVEWFEYLDWGRVGGRCFENGTIHLVHPENWKKGRKYNSERQWIQTVYHELGHYVLWADAERKADTFAYRFVRGVNANDHRLQDCSQNGVTLSRPRRRRPRSRSR